MIQELFGGGASTEILGGERKISISSVLQSPSPSPLPSPSSSIATTPAASSAAPKTTENQTLKCPRCDSPNTKFCYYNNYNLTQPRHFCKTCRRYWTKGGALRNVPIGGGCRQNRTTTFAAPSPVGKSITTNKLKTLGMSSDIEKSIFMGGFNHELSSNPILWPGPSQSSHLLASLLRATTQNPNPNPNFSSNMGTLRLDSMGQAPSMGFGSSFWKNNVQNQAQQEQQQNGGFVLGEIQNNIGGNSNQLYQWLRSSPGTNYYHPEHTTNVASSISSISPSSAILNSAPVAGGEMGFWNPALSWSDLSTANGAYP